MPTKETLSKQRECALTLLSEHTPFDAEEEQDCQRMAAFIRTHPNCYGKSNPQGHITGSAFVLDPKNRVLMTFHGKLHRWLQLGGHSDDDEGSPALTALREAEEESGLVDLVFHPTFGNRPVDIDIHTIPARRTEPEHEHLDFRFVFLTQRPETIVMSAESTRLKWWSLGAMTELGFDPALNRALRKIREGLGL